jgi:hypothetical protein
MKKILTFSLMCLFLFVFSCKKAEKDPDPIPNNNSAYKTVTLTHDGFDFSAGHSDTVDWQNNDCDLIGWHSGILASHPTYASNTTYTWIRNDQVDNVNYQSWVKNYGNIDETTITSTTVNNDSIIDPLLVGDVWVVKCHDGFAKFKVLSVNGVDWEANVKYVYTSTNSFSD